MKVEIQIPEYHRNGGLSDATVDGHRLSVTIDNGEVLVFGNPAGLIWLATNLMALSQEPVPSGYHQHFSQDYGLEPESVDLVIGKL